MATYVIGDIQGCASAFFELLDKCRFKAGEDRLWIAGDLVNRGPDNLSVLRYLSAMPSDQLVVVLGNHDLHLLAVANGGKKRAKKDTISDVLEAPDGEQLLNWLRHQKLAFAEQNFVISHAGIPHIWSVDKALQLAGEVERTLQGPAHKDFLSQMYGNRPDRWQEDLQGMDRLRAITNYFTRMRFIAPDGRLDFDAKEGLHSAPPGMQPWFNHPHNDDYTYIFGHWAALQGQTPHNKYIATDTGCVWGGCLTALRLEDEESFSVSCDASSKGPKV